MMKKLYQLLLGIVLVFICGWSLAPAAKAAVLWDGMPIKAGQIGRITIFKPINLWERSHEGLKFIRVLYPGERYRVYRYDKEYGGQYGLGSGLYVTNINGYLKYDTPSNEKKFLLNCNQSCILSKMVEIEGEDYSDEMVISMKKNLSHIPQEILYKLLMKQTVIKLVNFPITDSPDYSSLKGVVPRGWEGTGKTWDDVPGIGGTKDIMIRIGFSNKGHGSYNLELHETAHTIDNIIFHGISTSPPFIKLWNKEKNEIFPDSEYFLSYSEEYFAEVYSMYYLNGQTRKMLETEAPLTYKFISQLN